MGPSRCQKCAKCGSSLAQSPSEHREPESHDFSLVETVETDQGQATITRCRYCHHTKKEIGKEESEVDDD